jgi:hypothetical protein
VESDTGDGGGRLAAHQARRAEARAQGTDSCKPPRPSQPRAGLVAHSKRTLTDCGRPRWLAGSWLARRPPNATSAPRCPSTELRGNLAYYSILAAAGLQCATPWPALIRNSSLRNGHVCLFYPPRAHSATPHENTAQLAAQPTSLPERPLRADACAGRRGLRASSSASLPLTPASASHRSEPGDQGLSPSFRIHASGPGALSPSWPLLCSEPATLDGCWREACGGRVLRANPRLHPLTSRVPLS